MLSVLPAVKASCVGASASASALSPPPPPRRKDEESCETTWEVRVLSELSSDEAALTLLLLPLLDGLASGETSLARLRLRAAATAAAARLTCAMVSLGSTVAGLRAGGGGLLLPPLLTFALLAAAVGGVAFVAAARAVLGGGLAAAAVFFLLEAGDLTTTAAAGLPFVVVVGLALLAAAAAACCCFLAAATAAAVGFVPFLVAFFFLFAADDDVATGALAFEGIDVVDAVDGDRHAAAATFGCDLAFAVGGDGFLDGTAAVFLTAAAAGFFFLGGMAVRSVCVWEGGGITEAGKNKGES